MTSQKRIRMTGEKPKINLETCLFLITCLELIYQDWWWVYVASFIYLLFSSALLSSLTIKNYIYLAQLYWVNWQLKIIYLAQLVGSLSHTPKVCGFNPWSGHIPRLWALSLVGSCVGGNWPMFLTLIFLSLFLSLLSFFFKINKYILLVRLL